LTKNTHPEAQRAAMQYHLAYSATELQSKNLARKASISQSHKLTHYNSPALTEYSTTTSLSRDLGMPQPRKVDGPPIIAKYCTCLRVPHNMQLC